MNLIQEKLNIILEKIQAFDKEQKRVKLIAVSKTKPVEMMLAAYQAGQHIFGENKVQEAQSKKPFLPLDLNLHLIGPLQKNKAKYCSHLFSTIHSLDNFPLAELLNRYYQENNIVLDVLIQMNLSQEISKNGLKNEEELAILIERILTLPFLQLKGLMTIPDPTFNTYQTSHLYHQLYELNEKMARQFNLQKQMTELSMGMSDDFELALKEGATYIRIGTGIFGTRNTL